MNTEQQEKPEQKDYYILSVDGGGIRGVFAANLLHLIETKILKEKNQSLFNQFNMFAGTSTGGIIASGIAAEINIEEIIQIYKEEGKKIFTENQSEGSKTLLLSLLEFLDSKFEKLEKHYLLEKYNIKFDDFQNGINDLIPLVNEIPFYQNDELQQILENKLSVKDENGKKKNIYLSDIKKKSKRLLITAYETNDDQDFVFDSETISTDIYEGEKVEIWQAVLCSSAAPGYFPPVKFREKILVDGGLVANNPAAIAVAHAINQSLENPEFECPLSRIKVLSIGTGLSDTTLPHEIEQKPDNMFSRVKSLKNIFDAFADGHSDMTDRIVRKLLPNSTQYLRLQTRIESPHTQLDNVSKDNIEYLKKQAETLFADKEDDIRRFFGDE